MPVAWAAPLQLQRLDCTSAKHSAISNPFEESSHSGFTHGVNTLHHSRPGFKYMGLDWVFWLVLSTRCPKRVPLSVQLDTTAAEGPRLEIVCHSSFSLSPHCLLLWFVLWTDTTDSWRFWLMNHQIRFLWVHDSFHCFFKVCLLKL